MKFCTKFIKNNCLLFLKLEGITSCLMKSESPTTMMENADHMYCRCLKNNCLQNRVFIVLYNHNQTT